MEKYKIIAATRNKHKLRELSQMVGSLPFQIISQDEAGLADLEVIEDGDTFEANSFKKANEIMKISGMSALADDSGLMVEALGGEPGVYSARYAGVGATDQENSHKLLVALDGHQSRSAKFVSVITLITATGQTLVARGECEGQILAEPRGHNGFGYDPLFVPNGFDKTFAELSESQKNTISHRAKAIATLKEQIENITSNLEDKHA